MSKKSEAFESVLALSDDLSYFPRDYYAPRRPAFVGRVLLLALLAMVAYAPAVNGPFVWLDVPNVRGNLLLRSVGGLGRIWRHPGASPSYRPLAFTALWLQYRVFRSAAVGYHAFSVALHATGGVLLWFVLRRLAVPGAWLIACVFLLHPVQAQAVAWVSAQDTVLATTFSLGAMLAYLRFARVHPYPPEQYIGWFISRADGTLAPDPEGGLPPERRRVWYAIALLLFVAALLSRPSAAAVPVLLAILIGWKSRGLPRGAWKPLLPFFVVAALWLAVQAWAGHFHPVPVAAPAGGRWSLAARAVLFSAGKVCVPYPLLFVYPFSEAAAVNVWPTLIGGVALAGLLIAAGGLRGAAGVGCYLVALLPACGIISTEWLRYSFVADTFQYLACAGLIALWVGGLVGWLSKDAAGGHLPDSRRRARLAVGCGLALLLGGLTFRQAMLYGSEKDLWEHTLAWYPRSAVAHMGLGNLYLGEGKPADAIVEFRRTLEADPRDVTAITRLGRALEECGRFDMAADQYRRAAELQPREAQHQASLAAAYGREGNLPAALDAYARALSLRPDDELIHNNLGLLLAESGQPGRAVAEYELALKLNPDSLPVRINLANALFREGRLDDAAEQLQQVMHIDPNNFEAYMNAGAMLGQLKHFDKAERMYRAAVQVRPTSAEAYNYLGIALAAQGNLSEANFSFGKAVELKPSFEDAGRNLRRSEEQIKARDEKLKK